MWLTVFIASQFVIIAVDGLFRVMGLRFGATAPV
jgi:hypothetical protein